MNRIIKFRTAVLLILFTLILLYSIVCLYKINNHNAIESTTAALPELSLILDAGIVIPPKYMPLSSEAIFAGEVLRLTNIEREKVSLTPLSGGDEKLNAVARIRAEDIAADYQSNHTRPNGDSFATLFKILGVVCTAGGENIAAGHGTPLEVVDAWMNSESHRVNILNPKLTHLEIGVVFKEDGYGVYCVQEFKG